MSGRGGVKDKVKEGAGSYVMSAGGQSKRVDLCVALAFQSLVEMTFKTNISIFDEFDASLDEEGVNRFVEFLEEEAEKKGSVFVISHNIGLQSLFSKVWMVDNSEVSYG